VGYVEEVLINVFEGVNVMNEWKEKNRDEKDVESEMKDLMSEKSEKEELKE
jgi:hypothetical protein